ncbi:DUF397 domain-containing protein [Kitasatospora sp. NPDC056181]|uniref:DUF397 domain-containing protein n=1 Tax=Kitasatospora sp. NPDC056181 TaxID=3345737 RepID=UPI0035D54D03
METPLWTRPSACADSTNCPEVAISVDTVYLRSSLHPSSVAKLTKDEWRVLLTGIRSGEFDV